MKYKLFWLSVEYIYLAARLACLALQWIKERSISKEQTSQTIRLVWCMVKSGPVFCSLAP